MPVLKIKNNGKWETILGGAGDSVEVDTSLTQEGKAADAKSVGDALETKQPKGNYALKSEIPSIDGLATEDYVNEQISKIPTPDVSGQIEEHNTSEEAHSDIRASLSGLQVDIDNKADNIQTKTGSTITANNSAHTPLKGLKIFGKTTQNGTPSPDAPVPLDTAGSGGSIEVKVCGRNLAEKITVGSSTNRFATALYIEAKLKPNTTYTLSFIGSVNNYYYLNEYLIQKYTSFVVKEGINTLTFTTKTELPLGDYRSDGWVIVKNDTNNLAENIFNDVMLVEGSTTVPYEPYVSGGSLTVSTPNGLPGIPVTSGGNYTDSVGQQWVCDSIDFARGKYVQRVHKQVFTQNNNYIMQQENIVRGYSNVKSVDGGAVISTHLKSGPYGGVDSITMGFVGEQIYFSRFATVDDFKSILGDTGMTVYYVLETPIETDLTEEQLAAYVALHTNYPNSTIYNDAGADMEVKYYTPNTAVQMVHSPADEGKVLAIDEHGCVVLSDDVGGGTISIDLNGVNEGEVTPTNADSLGGYTANEYVRKDELSDYNFVTKNYSIVDGPEVPENPTENMIWIQTGDIGTITNNVISRVEPKKRTEGLAWIVVGNNSNVNFHKLKVNDVYVEEVYPISAKIYTNGTWVEHVAQTYQNGEWVHWLPEGALYWHGTQMVDWIAKSSVGKSDWTAIAPTFGDSTVTIAPGEYANKFCGIVTKDKVDITGYTKLVIEFESVANVDNTRSLHVHISTKQTEWITGSSTVATKAIESNPGNVVELPFTASGLYYIDIFCIRTAEVKIKRVYLVK